MTSEQAAQIVTELENGKRFVTRFQEQEWGVYFEADGRFVQWSSVFMQIERELEFLNRQETIQLFERYDFEKTMSSLR